MLLKISQGEKINDIQEISLKIGLCSDDSLLSYYIIWDFKSFPAFQRDMLHPSSG